MVSKLTRRSLLASTGAVALAPKPLHATWPSGSGRFKPTTISSAGVFNSSNQLVRTIWAAQANDPRVGQPPSTWWDGTDDDNNVLASGTYTIQLLTNKCTYTWDGLVGNSTPNHSCLTQAPGQVQKSTTYISATSVMTSMAIDIAGDAYFCFTNGERLSSVAFTTTSDMGHAFRPSNWPTAGLGGGSSTLSWDGLGAYSFNCSDGANIYHAIAGPSGVIGVVGSTHAQILFSAGDSNHMAGAFGASTGNSYIESIACQAGGSGFIFIARPLDTTSGANGRIWVLKETDGSIATQSTAANFPQILACNPNDGSLWVYYTATGSGIGDTIQKFTVNAVTGALTASGVIISVSGSPVITGNPKVSYMAVSPDGSTLLVADTTTDQVRAFNTSDGSVKTAFGNSGTLGLAGGYLSNGPAVADNKFALSAAEPGLSGSIQGAFICFDPSDSSWWLGDVGNYRYLHFSSGNSPTVIARTSFIPLFYSCAICNGDPTRVFANFLEFKIDYSKNLDAGAWTLVKNWSIYNSPYDSHLIFDRLCTYSNGRTYGLLNNTNTGLLDVFELDPINGPRNTGKSLGNGARLDIPSGDLFTCDVGTNGGRFAGFGGPSVGTGGGGFLYRNPFTGFDGSNNPTWAGDPTKTANSWTSGSPATGWVTVVQSQSPLPVKFPDLEIFHPPVRPLANNVLPLWKNRSIPGQASGGGARNFVYELGGIDATTGQYRFFINPPALVNAGGVNNPDWNFPDLPYNASAQGSNGGYGGSIAYVSGKTDIFTQFNAEGWGNGAGTIWSHWHQSGLPVGRFGAILPFFASFAEVNPNKQLNGDNIPNPSGGFFFQGLPGAAGNVGGGALGYDLTTSDKAYIYHSQEWPHAGMHRWTIAGLSSISLSTVATINWVSSSYVAPSIPGDLLHGLPFDNQNLTSGTAGWTRSAQIGSWPTDPVFGQGGSYNWIVATNAQKNDPHLSPDLHNFINVSGSTPGGFGVLPLQVARTIPRVKTTDWKLTISAVLYRPGGIDSVGDGNSWFANSTNVPANNVGQTFNGQWIDIVDGSNNRIISIFTGGYVNPARSFPFSSGTNVSLWINESPLLPIADFAWSSAQGNNLGLYAAGGYQAYTGEAPLFDGSHLHHLPVLTIASNILANTVTVTYGRGNKMASITVGVYDAGASITGVSALQVNYKADGSGPPVNCGIDIMGLQYTEA